jgi:hypothetical protein
MLKIRKLLCLYVAMALLVSNTLGVSVAAAQPWKDSSKYAEDLSKRGHNKEQKSDSKDKEKEEEEEDSDGGGGGGGSDGGGGGGGLGGMLGKMMESLLPLMMMMMMMNQNKNNQQPTPAALATVPPTFTPIQLFTAVPTSGATTVGNSSVNSDSKDVSVAFPTLPPMQ